MQYHLIAFSSSNINPGFQQVGLFKGLRGTEQGFHARTIQSRDVPTFQVGIRLVAEKMSPQWREALPDSRKHPRTKKRKAESFIMAKKYALRRGVEPRAAVLYRKVKDSDVSRYTTEESTVEFCLWGDLEASWGLYADNTRYPVSSSPPMYARSTGMKQYLSISGAYHYDVYRRMLSWSLFKEDETAAPQF